MSNVVKFPGGEFDPVKACGTTVPVEQVTMVQIPIMGADDEYMWAEIPLSVFTDIAEGKMNVSDLEGFNDVMRSFVIQWLQLEFGDWEYDDAD